MVLPFNRGESGRCLCFGAILPNNGCKVLSKALLWSVNGQGILTKGGGGDGRDDYKRVPPILIRSRVTERIVDPLRPAVHSDSTPSADLRWSASEVQESLDHVDVGRDYCIGRYYRATVTD